MNCGFFLLNIIEEILGFGSYNIGILVGLLIMLVSFKGSRGSFGFYQFENGCIYILFEFLVKSRNDILYDVLIVFGKVFGVLMKGNRQRKFEIVKNQNVLFLVLDMIEYILVFGVYNIRSIIGIDLVMLFRGFYLESWF